MSQTKDFSAYISNWINENCPKSMMTPMPASEQVWASSSISFPNSDSEKWFNAMTQTGYSTPEWPKEYGGAGLDFEQARILRQELKKKGCRNPQINFGITMLGPVLLEFGTEDQKKEFGLKQLNLILQVNRMNQIFYPLIFLLMIQNIGLQNFHHLILIAQDYLII